MVIYADIEVAADRLAGVAHRTPVMTSRQFSVSRHLSFAALIMPCLNYPQRKNAKELLLILLEITPSRLLNR